MTTRFVRLRAVVRGLSLLLVLCWVPAIDASAQTCAPWVTKLTRATRDPVFQARAQDWVRRFQATEDPVVARGMLKLVIEKDTKAVLEYFAALPPSANPFANEEAVYRALGRFVTDRYDDAMPGIRSLVGNLMAETASNEKGALGALFIADRIVATGKTVKSFEHPMLNGARKIDVVEASHVAEEANLPGILREVKNWPTALSGASDSKLVRLVEEFEQDITIHAQAAAGRLEGAFDHYRLDLHLANPADLDMIRTAMEAAFDRSTVDNAAGLKSAFLARWGRNVTLF